MRILVVSDTHGKLERVYQVYKKLREEAPLDLIVHCGDYEADARELQARLGVHVACVKGNCDGSFSDTDFSILETEFGNFIISHGHMENVDFSMQNLFYKAEENGCIGALFGHTHRAVYTQIGDIYMMNPGSLSRPRDGSGGTFGLLITEENSVWGKIYRFEDFVEVQGGGKNGESGDIRIGGAGAAQTGEVGGAGDDDSASGGQTCGSGATKADGSANDKIGESVGAAPRTCEKIQACETSGAVSKTCEKAPKKVTGGYLKGLLNYSDRF